MTKKELYILPDVLVFNVKVEGIICGSEFGEPGAPGSTPNFYDYNEF